MLCCKRKKHEYEINPEDDPNVVKQKDLEGKDDDDDKTELGKTNGVVEAPIEVKVSEATEEVAAQTSPAAGLAQTGSETKEDSGEKTVDDKVKNPKYVSQMSMCSTLSVREEINRNREVFFSNTSLNDPSLQEDWSSFNKRLSRTDEKFAEYQRRLRARKRLAEEEEMSVEQMQQAVARLESVASRLEALAVHSPRAPSTTSGGSAAGPDPGLITFLSYCQNCLRKKLYYRFDQLIN